MTTSTVWAVLHDHNDEVAAGPFDTAEEANAFVAGFDDVYAARVQKVDFDRHLAEMNTRGTAMPWHSDYSNIVSLVEHLAEMGWSGKEIAHVVAKPGAYTDEYEMCVSGIAAAEPGL